MDLVHRTKLAAADLVTLTDKGYQGAAHAKTPYKGKKKPQSQKDANCAHAKLRAPGEERTHSSRHRRSSPGYAAAPAPDRSPGCPRIACSRGQSRDEKGSFHPTV